MPIGEFGRPPQLPEETGGPVLSTPLYWFYEWGQAALNPSRALADATKLYLKHIDRNFRRSVDLILSLCSF